MNLQTYVIAALLAILADTIMGIIKKSPPYLIAPFVRFWKETTYLHSILHDTRFAQWSESSKKYVSLMAINALGGKQKKPWPVLDLLLSNTITGKPVVLLGEPGSGKSTVLEALTFHLARTAYRSNCFLWFVLLIIAISLSFYSPILCLYWLASFSLWEFLGRRSVIPVFIDARSDYTGGSITKWREEILSNLFKSKPLFGSFNRIVWIIDGINETPSNLYATFIEGWRADLKREKGNRIIFSSRQEENPALRLGIENVLTIKNLDNIRVKEFLRIYSKTNIPNEKISTEVLSKSFMNSLIEEDLLDDDGIGRNPFWLKMMIESNFFTSNRGMLFLSYTNKLIQREIEEKPEERKRKPEWKTVPVDIEIDALADLALVMQKEDRIGLEGEGIRKQAYLAVAEIIENTSFTLDDILGEANAATLLRVRTRESIVFSHHLLQEVFAAYAFRNHKNWVVLKNLDYILKWRGLLIITGEFIESGGTSAVDDFIKAILGDQLAISRLLVAISIVINMKDEAKSQSTRLLVEKQFDIWLFHLIDSSHISEITQCIQQEGATGDLSVADFMVSRLVVNLKKPERRNVFTDILVSLDELAAYALVDALKVDSGFIIEDLVRIVYRIGESAFFPLLRNYDLLSHDIRHEVIEVMGRIQSQTTVNFLIKACTNTDDENLLLAALMLLNVHATLVNYYIFLEELNNSHPFVRWVSCYALGIIGSIDAISYLETIRKQDNEFYIFYEYPYNLNFNVTKYSLRYGSNDYDRKQHVTAKVSSAAENALQRIFDNTKRNENVKGHYLPKFTTTGSPDNIIRRELTIMYTKGLEWEDWIGYL